MTKQLDERLDEILKAQDEKVKKASNKYDGYPVNKGRRELRQAIKTLISEEVDKARIEELKLHAAEWCEINEDGSINPRAVYDRLATLQEQSEESI